MNADRNRLSLALSALLAMNCVERACAQDNQSGRVTPPSAPPAQPVNPPAAPIRAVPMTPSTEGQANGQPHISPGFSPPPPGTVRGYSPPPPGAVPGYSPPPPGASFAKQDGTTGTYMPPGASPPPPAVGQPAKPSNIPTGSTVSPVRADSRAIEAIRPERVKVYPDDPDSAWWEINPHYAFDRAQREQKPLMLLFTGIWNTQAMGLSQEVFSTKSFNEYVKENLVICYLNYERSITDNPLVLRRLKEKFKVRGYPNVLIFNPNGEVERGIRGYRTGRPVDYFQQLKTACMPVLESIKVQKEELKTKGFRDWSNYLGKLVFARFVRHDGTLVSLQDVSGQKWTVKINDLSPDDQKLVESFPAGPSLAEPAE